MDDCDMPPGEDRMFAREQRKHREAREREDPHFEQMSTRRIVEWIDLHPLGSHQTLLEATFRVDAHAEWRSRVVDQGDPEAQDEARRLKRAELRSWIALGVAIASIVITLAVDGPL